MDTIINLCSQRPGDCVEVGRFKSAIFEQYPVVTVWRWLNVTATPIWDCTFSPAVLWAVGILYPRTLWVHLQSTASRDIWIFWDRRRWISLWTSGPHNPIWLPTLMDWCLDLMLTTGAATPGELPGEHISKKVQDREIVTMAMER